MKSFSIKNIKSFQDSGVIEVKPITIFVGRNSCGKSSLIRFPVVMAQTLHSDGPIKFYGEQIDYGNYEDVLCRNACGLMEYSFSYEISLNNGRPYGAFTRDAETGEPKSYGNNYWSSFSTRTFVVNVILEKVEDGIRYNSISVVDEIDNRCVYRCSIEDYKNNIYNSFNN